MLEYIKDMLISSKVVLNVVIQVYKVNKVLVMNILLNC